MGAANGTAKRIGVASMGVMRPELMMKSAAVGTQEVAARALVLLLSVRSNRKEFTREEKNVLKLVQRDVLKLVQISCSSLFILSLIVWVCFVAFFLLFCLGTRFKKSRDILL